MSTNVDMAFQIQPLSARRMKAEYHGVGVLGLTVRKQLREHMLGKGMPEASLPKMFRDRPVARSRKSKAGQIVVRELTGVVPSRASKVAQRLERELSGGREDIIEKLEASGVTIKNIPKVIEILKENPRYSFARAIAEAKADVAHTIESYAKGALQINKLESVLAIYKEMPAILRDLVRHAIDHEETCDLCFGLGIVQARTGGKVNGGPCPRCKGSKVRVTSSKHKEFALRQLLEMSEVMPKKTPMVNVQQAVQVNTGGGGEGDLLERMSKAADAILYASGPSKQEIPDVVDAEVLSEPAEQ